MTAAPITQRPTTRPVGSGDEDALGVMASLLDVGAIVKATPDPVPCQENEPELWFAERPDDVEFAKALCGTCPARELCLATALERGEPWGVWGGELFVGGLVVPRKRPRGRPRKDAAA